MTSARAPQRAALLLAAVGRVAKGSTGRRGRAAAWLSRPTPAASLAIAAAALWIAVWTHQQAAHGRTQVNEMRIVLGMTWMDSGKLLALVPLLLLGAALRLRAQAPPGAARAGFTLFALLLPAFSLATLVQFGPFPWGSYELTFEESAVARAGGLAQSLLSLALLAAVLVAGVPAARARAIPPWLVAVLAMGALTAFFLTPATWIPTAAWLAWGGAILRERWRVSGRSALRMR